MKIIRVVKDKNRIAGYVVSDGRGITKVSKDKAVELIQLKMIDNATLQKWQGKYIIRIKDNDSKTKDTEDRIVSADRNITKVGNSLPYKGSSIADSIAVTIKSNNKHELYCQDAINILNNTAEGVPLKVKMNDYLEWKQCIFIGSRYDNNRKDNIFRFFDGSGVTGTFDFSQKYISNNDKIKFKFNDNDPTETAFLLNYIKKGPFDLGK